MNASKLFFILDRFGIMAGTYKIPDDVYLTSDGVVSQLKTAQAGAFLDLNATKRYDEQLDLVGHAYRACTSGVQRVHVIDGRVEGMLLKEIFSNRGFGTMIYADRHDNIRPMVIADIPGGAAGNAACHRRRGACGRGPRATLKSGWQIMRCMRSTARWYAVLRCTFFRIGRAKSPAFVVDDTYTNLGIGRRMVSYFIEQAAAKKLKALFVLTTQTSDWFSQLGFVPGKGRRSSGRSGGKITTGNGTCSSCGTESQCGARAGCRWIEKEG